MAREISPERKTMYYLGTGLLVVGGLLFLSVFVSFFSRFGDFRNFESRASSDFTRAFAGMILAGLGAGIRSVAARGLAGSGVILSPEDAREDLEPYSRMAGGMLRDALDEADVRAGGAVPKEVIRVKCRTCGGLNEEDARFCKACGEPL